MVDDKFFNNYICHYSYKLTTELQNCSINYHCIKVAQPAKSESDKSFKRSTFVKGWIWNRQIYLISRSTLRLIKPKSASINVYRNVYLYLYVKKTAISHFWDRPVPIFSDLRFSYRVLVQDKKIMCVLPANACCTVYVNCPSILHAFPF